MKLLKWIGGLLIFLTVGSSASAKTENGFVTIINPIRISYYNSDPVASLQAQYGIINKLKLPATWLITFDVMDKSEMISEIKKFDKNQEIGLFLEVSRNFSEKSNIEYHETGSWHFANSVLLSGYTQEERKKFIDILFEKYKSIFGEYPTSVGSWWTDSFSLNYMKEKYGITADLGCADQLGTDNYSIWGQYWSTPYYPSKYHTGIPAGNNNTKLGIVRLQWAARDPRNGYYSSAESVQDNPKIFKKLLDLYAAKHDNQFGQITVGLEGDLAPSTYGENFKNQMTVVANSDYQITTMKQFAAWYINKFPDISPTQQISSDGAVWIMSPEYRQGQIDGKIIDKRIYNDKLLEPYYVSPNRERTLYINIDDSKQPTGITYADWSAETSHAFKSNRFLLGLIFGKGWNKIYRQTYFIPPDELIALRRLSQMKKGKVLVVGQECLQCEWHTKYPHPAFANKRDYVAKYSSFPIIYIPKIDKDIRKLGAKYLYLVKFEGYIESLGNFSPGDIGAEKVYENANSQIWKF